MLPLDPCSLWGLLECPGWSAHLWPRLLLYTIPKHSCPAYTPGVCTQHHHQLCSANPGCPGASLARLLNGLLLLLTAAAGAESRPVFRVENRKQLSCIDGKIVEQVSEQPTSGAPACSMRLC